MSDGRTERWLEAHSGWGQLVLTFVVLGAQAIWVYRGLTDQAQANQDAAISQHAEMAELNRNIKDLAGNVTRLAIANERLAEHMTDTDRRVNRLELLGDGKR